MKMNKKQAALIAGLVCVVLLLVLLLSMCSGEETVAPTVPTESAVVETTQVTEAPTEQTQETTEATEETTEATEETTEATEETTEATEPTGNTRPGGTGGYNPGLGGGNTDTNQPVTETTPAAGSEGSPYYEVMSSLPGSFKTVTIPVNGTIYHSVVGVDACVLTIADADAYVIYGEQTYIANEDGIVEVAILTAETEGAPVVFQVGSKNAEEKAYELTFQAPLGTEGNPEPVIAQEGVITVKAALPADDTDGYFYGFTAQENSRLTLQVDKITENTACEIIVTVNETVTKLSECEDGLISVEVKQEETALIQVIAVPAEDGTYPAVEVEISGTVESAPGSSTNPIVVYGEFPIVTDEIAPGASVFYSVYGATDMTLNVEAADVCITVDGVTYAPVDGVVSTLITAADPRTPVTIVVGNSGEETKSFTLELIPALGSMNNPEAMVEGTNTASIQEGDTDGYWFSWTAESDAMVTITMPEGDWMYQVEHASGDQISYGDTQWSDSDPLMPEYEVKVLAGDVLKLMVNTYDPEMMWSNPAGEISFQLSVVQHVDVTYRGAELNLQPDETVFCYARINTESIILKVTGEGEFTVNVNGRDYNAENGAVAIEGVESSMYQPALFTITNRSDTAGTYTVRYENPVGSMENPAVIEEMGEFTAEVKGDGQGYYYTWTAPADGELTVEMGSDDWYYTVNNLTDSGYGEGHSSKDDEVTASEILTVTEGDKIQIILGTASGETKDVTIVVSFQPAIVDVTYRGATLSLNPGKSVSCYARINTESIILKVTGEGEFTVNVNGRDYNAENGVVAIEGVESSMYQPALFTITNCSDTAGTYTVRYENPVGSMENPAVIEEMGEFTAEVKGDGQGYYYTWTALSDGELTVEMASDDWYYTVNNLTDSGYGEGHSSKDEEVTASEILTVTEGDKIQIILGTASGETKDVTIAVSFQPAVVDVTYRGATLSLNPGKSVSCYARINTESIILKVTGEGEFTVNVNGRDYNAENGVVAIEGVESTMYQPALFTITNCSDTAGTYTVRYENPVGSMENPAVIEEMGEFTAEVKGDGQGYYYTWTAPADGELTVEMGSDDWYYTVNNLTDSGYGEGHSSKDEEVTASEILTVTEGDKIQIILGTASGETKDVTIAVSFRSAQEETPAEDTTENNITIDDTDAETTTGSNAEVQNPPAEETTEGADEGTAATEDTSLSTAEETQTSESTT